MAYNDDTYRLARALKLRVSEDTDQAVRLLVQAWARAWDELHTTWADAAMDVAAASTDAPVPGWRLERMRRVQQALALSTDAIYELSEFTEITVVDGVGRVVEYTPPAEAEIIGSQLPAGTELRAEFDAGAFGRLDEAQLRSIVERTSEQIHATTVPLPAVAQEAMRRALVQAVAVGDNPRTTARHMLDRAEGAFNGGLARAMTIARTEMLDAHRAAAQAMQLASTDVLTAWIWEATLDRRTCPSCWAKHGTRFDLTEPGPNDHQQGRCARTPVTKTWRELGFDIDEPSPTFRDARTAFDALPRDEQLQVMGRRRLAALDAGEIAWGDLAQQRSNGGWRDSWVPTPLRDLGLTG